ncbi:MAG TPA: cell division protein ZipA C-terminal FtsZ-binding domain-containing protein [Steroidobacteraceae bacterium]|nr:cell division protein ZipA C-terminal FtsZ-binding domain-containing protein [Steroidobacteraceae bacterium]
MPELRIILLVAGVLFLAGLAGFEWWRQRGSRPLKAMPQRDDQPDDSAPTRAAPLPELNVVRDARVAVSDSLPVIELASTSASGTRRALGISISDEVAVDVSQQSASGSADKPTREEPYIGRQTDQGIDNRIGVGADISEVRVIDEQPVTGPQLVLAWPGEAERRIVALRVIPRIEPRFAGRTLRQAFASAGFWHGPLDIYHLPDDKGRVLLSAAALAQPGTFDPSIMDSQRFSGLNMFAVLPGPLPERETFDELVHAARQLADRLDGTLTDQHGDELTAQRIARLRQSLEASPTARVAGES